MGIKKQKSVNVKLAHICLAIASYFRAAAKFLVPGMVADALSLPGWFVVHQNLIKQTNYSGGVVGFEWESYTMPPAWCEDMAKLAGKGGR